MSISTQTKTTEPGQVAEYKIKPQTSMAFVNKKVPQLRKNIITMKGFKYLGIYLTENILALYDENYKALKK